MNRGPASISTFETRLMRKSATPDDTATGAVLGAALRRVNPLVSVTAVVVRIVSGVGLARDHRDQTLNNCFGAAVCSVVQSYWRAGVSGFSTAWSIKRQLTCPESDWGPPIPASP